MDDEGPRNRKGRGAAEPDLQLHEARDENKLEKLYIKKDFFYPASCNFSKLELEPQPATDARSGWDGLSVFLCLDAARTKKSRDLGTRVRRETARSSKKKEGATDEDVVDALLRDLGVHVVGDNEPEEEPRLCTPRAVTARAGGWKVVFFQATN